jgi:cytoskeleton protein RodZ
MTDPNAEPHLDPEAATPQQVAPPAESPGAILLAERRNQGLSLGDIARQLKLSVRQVEALERDDYAAFSGPLFVRGFLRNYAKLLHLEPEALLAAANLSATPVSVGPPAAAYVPVSAANPEGRRKFVAWSVTVVLAIIVLMLLASNVSKDRREPAPSAVAQGPSAPVTTPQHADSPPATLSPAQSAATVDSAPKAAPAAERETQAPEPEPAPPATTALAAAPKASPPVESEPTTAAPPTAPQAAGGAKPHVMVSGTGTSQIRMTFEGESWVEVKDGSGATIFSRLNTAGTERVIKGTPPLTVVVGNAHGVKLTYRDKAIDLGPHTRVDVARITLE